MEEQSADSVQIRRNELIHKCINLQVLKELSQRNETMIQEKRAFIVRQTNELDKLHEEVWSFQSKMCDEVWDFSGKHDFIGILNNYPNIPSDLSLNCDCEEETNKENTEAQQLRTEIEEIQSILNDQSHDLLKEDLAKAEKELHCCKQESMEIKRLRREISETKRRISNLKTKIETNFNAIQDNAHFAEIENEIVDFEDFSPDSSATVNYPQNRRSNQLRSSQSVFPKNNNYYNRISKHSKNSNSDSGFVKASTLISNEESQRQFNNNPQCEKIIAEAVSNDDKLSGTANQPKKKFVPKMKSQITQGKKR